MSMAPQFWRLTPALAFAAPPLAVAFASLFADAFNVLPGLDWAAFRFVAILSLLIAGFAFYQAPRIDRLTAGTVIATAFAIAWCAFLISGQYGAGVALIEGLMALLYIFAALAIVSSAYARFRWLRWIVLPLIVLASAACALWLGHELIYVYFPMMVRTLTPA